MSGIGTRLLDAAFGHPRGLLGVIGGRLMARGNADTERDMVAEAEFGGDDVVLVVGHGPGIGLRAAAARARLVIGIDPSETMRRQAAERCATEVSLGRVRIHDGTAERTGRADDSVDVVISVNNVQLWDDLDAGMAELYRVLRPGGRLLLSVHRHVIEQPERTLRDAAERAGFTEARTSTREKRGRMTPAAVRLRAVKPSR